MNGTNGGKNGGRGCWGLVGTLCGGKEQGSFAKAMDCLKCDFYRLVGMEEGPNYVTAREMLTKLH